MPFEKGNSKKGGRKPGSLNKNTERAKAIVDFLLTKMDDDMLEEMWQGLKSKEQMDAITKLLEYAIPKHARVENTNKLPSNVTINFLPASPDRLAEQNTIDITEHEEIK